MSDSPHVAASNDERYNHLQTFSQHRHSNCDNFDRQDTHWLQPHQHQQQQQQQRRLSNSVEAFQTRSNPVIQGGESRRESQTLISSPESQTEAFGGQSAFVATHANRGTKAHVPAACVNCQKAHLRCSTRRPCPRCNSMGKADTCVDVQHKKRGRPRLRDGRGLRSDLLEVAPSRPDSFERTPLTAQSSTSTIAHLQTSGSSVGTKRHQEEFLEDRTDSYRQSTAESEDDPGHSAFRAQPLTLAQNNPLGAAIALLDLDFKIVKSSQSLRHAFRQELELSGRNLLEIVPEPAKDKVLKLRCQLRDECRYRDPDFCRVPTNNEIGLIQSIEEADLQVATQNFHDRFERLPISIGNGSYREVMVVLRLAKKDVFFVVLGIPHSALETWTRPMLPSIMQVDEYSQQARQASSILPSLGNLPLHRSLSNIPFNPAAPYYFTQALQPSVPPGSPLTLKADEHSSQSQQHTARSTVLNLAVRGDPDQITMQSDDSDLLRTSYDRPWFEKFQSLQLPPMLRRSNSTEGNDNRSSSRSEPRKEDRLHGKPGRSSAKRERVDIEEMID